MLELFDITKVYPAGGENVHALKGVSLKFRESEFVSILGPSGCGKTTMLNIIGGLDKYTSGDLIINGISTKLYKDRDWDAYRNHSIGFVFQSYNLIPHQTVLQNVELALTLSGVSKKERRARAKEALSRVGLSDQLRKRPSEMSGGQMQRVAIARAIVNNPDIILADEPTGALDTETSVQVMDILKEISKDRLVIMVTHNPELAERYSTRIVRMLDGLVTDDSMPITDGETLFNDGEVEDLTETIKESSESGDSAPANKYLDVVNSTYAQAGIIDSEEPSRTANAKKEKVKQQKPKREKKPSMSFSTAFGLSLKNLFTKKGRTILTSFAGSIGIIGIALIYAVSNGMTTYIDMVQEQTLSSYPITIEAKSVSMSSLINTFMGKAESIEAHENDAVYQKAMIYAMINSLNTLEATENDLKSFKAFVEKERANEESKLYAALSAVSYGYDLDMTVYTKNVDDKIILSDTQQLMMESMAKFSGIDMSAITAATENSMMGANSSMMYSSMSLWKELLPGENGAPVSDITKAQYELLYGTWPTKYDEIVLFVDSRNELDDLTLYALGLKSADEIEKLMKASIDRVEVEYDGHSWSYEELCDMDFRTVLPADCYVYDESKGGYTDLRETDAGLKFLYDNGLKLHVTGIVKPDKNAVSNSENGSIGYTYLLTNYIINASHSSPVVIDQKADTETDIFTGLPFKSTAENLSVSDKAQAFKDHVEGLNDSGKGEIYIRMMSIPSDEMVQGTVAQTMASMTRADMEAAMIQALSQQMGMEEEKIAGYIASMSDEEMYSMFASSVEEQFKAQYAEQVAASMAEMTSQQLSYALSAQMATYSDEECAAFYDEIMEFSSGNYEANLVKLGCLELDTPSTINLYASSFADKDTIEEVISEYNDSVEDMQEIEYTDIVGILMSSITTIINAITYVLIAFVAVSLVVSSIMIGVITLISVQERTKEIGILRAIGASKKNVSSMFNAETVIIGFTSGALGVLITYLLCIPINAILHKLTDIYSLNAILPINVGIILVAISVFLTLIAGIIPSRSAAKKDPVVALRTE